MKHEQDGPSIAWEWWRALNPGDVGRSGRQRAALARIRRAASPLDVIQEPEALVLIARLRFDVERVAVLAGVLAFVRQTDHRNVARAVGRDTFDDAQSARLSEGRFRRLLQVPSGELMEPMRRLVRMADGKVNVRDLSSSILYWGDRTKRRWIFDYYGVAAGGRARAGVSVTPEE